MLSNEDYHPNSCSEDSCGDQSFENVAKMNENIKDEKGCFSSRNMYSGFNDLFGSTFEQSSLQMSPTNGTAEISSSDVNEHDINSHLKGALSFGLPTKSYQKYNTPRTNLPSYRQMLNFDEPEKPVNKSINRRKEKKIERKEIEKPKIDHLSEDLQYGYRILADLIGDSLKGSNGPFMEAINLDPKFNKEYLDVIKEPIWLPKIKEKLLGEEYTSITELIKDVRVMLENAYSFFGPAHSYTKKGLRIEFVMEQKISLLPKEVRDLCSIEKTNGISEEEQKEIAKCKGARKTLYGGVYLSYLLYRVRGFRQAREKEVKRMRMESLRQARLNKELEVVNWEGDIVTPHHAYIRAMWELPQIGQFVYLALPALNIGAISQYELERGLVIPEASMVMRTLMTSLISSPAQRLKISEKPYMPYKIWALKLANKVSHWYRAFYKEKRDPEKVFRQFGIEPSFWKICGEENPFNRFLFHEMTYYQRTWLVKSLCDVIGHNHKSIQDVIMEQPEEIQREVVLGTDKDNKEYIYFPQFIATDLRIFQRSNMSSASQENCSDSEDDKPLQSYAAHERIFTKEQVRAFRNLLKSIQRKKEREKDADWDVTPKKSRRKKRRSHKQAKHSNVSSPVVNNSPATESRTRPGNLRQRPPTRYSEDLMLPDLEESPIQDSTSGTSQDELSDESGTERKEQKCLSRAKVRNSFKKKQKPKCETCGRTFYCIGALNGHMITHAKPKTLKNKESNSSREGTPKPTKKRRTKGSEDQFENGNLCSPSTNETGVSPPPHTRESSPAAKVEEDVKKEVDSDAPLEKKPKIDLDATDGRSLSPQSIKNEPESSLTDKNSEKIKMEIKEEGIKDEKANISSQLRELNSLEVDSNSNVEKHIKEDSNEDSSVSPETSNKVDNDKESKSFTGDDCSLHNKENISTDLNNDENEEELNRPAGSVASESEVKENEDDSMQAEDIIELFPDLSQFELIASSIEDLRKLILRFGPLPKNRKSKEDRERSATPQEDVNKEDADEDTQVEEKEDTVNEEDKMEEDENEKEEKETPPVMESKHECEIELHRALCDLLVQLAPSDSKFKASHKQLRKKLWQEYSDWCKKDESQIDPDEEAWLSEPEPEPSPPPAETKPSSSSSSSEEEYTEDGIRKRKLRKRKAKKLSTPIIEEPLPTLNQIDEDSNDAITVSSRGRVRRIKKIVNYDTLDFDKLARQAEKELIEEKEKKKRRREEEMLEEKEEAAKQFKSAAETLNLPSDNIKKYVLSKSGRIIGYIDSDGKYNSIVESKKQTPSKETNLSPIRPIHVATRENMPIFSPISAPSTLEDAPEIPFTSSPKPSAVSISLSDKVPTMLVAAHNGSGGLVYVKINGDQALHLSKMLLKTKGLPPRLVKLQRTDQTFTFSSDSKILTKNIPGFPDCDLTVRPHLATHSQTLQNNSSPISNDLSKSAFESIKPVNKAPPVISKIIRKSEETPKMTNSENAAITTIVTSQPTMPTNTLALAYKGIPGVHSSISSGVKSDLNKSQVTPCVSLTASTKLVSATPSVVPSVTPFSYTKPIPSSATIQSKTTIPLTSIASNLSTLGQIATKSPTNPPSSLLSVKAPLSSSSATQSINKLPPGQKLVAFSNGKGGYTLTLISANTNSKASNSSVNNSPIKAVSSAPNKSLNISGELCEVNSPNLKQSPSKGNVQNRLSDTFSHINKSPALPNVLINSNQMTSQSNSCNRQIEQTPPRIMSVNAPRLVSQNSQPVVQIANQNQNPQQKVLQIVQAGNRQVLQFVQPVMVSESSNTFTLPNNSLTQNSVQSQSYILQPQSVDQKHNTFVQPRLLVQASPQQAKYVQVAKPEQILHTIPNTQFVQQQLVIQQPQPQHIVFQQPSILPKATANYTTRLQENDQGSSNQTFMIQAPQQVHSNSQTLLLQQSSQPTQQVILQNSPTLEQSNQVFQQISSNDTLNSNAGESIYINSSQHVDIANSHQSSNQIINDRVLTEQNEASLEQQQQQHSIAVQNQPQIIIQQQGNTSAPQQACQSPLQQKTVFVQHSINNTLPSVQQVKNKSPKKAPQLSSQNGRILLVQTPEGQKFCFQSSEGQISLLNSEQLQPLINNGTLKISQ